MPKYQAMHFMPGFLLKNRLDAVAFVKSASMTSFAYEWNKSNYCIFAFYLASGQRIFLLVYTDKKKKKRKDRQIDRS